MFGEMGVFEESSFPYKLLTKTFNDAFDLFQKIVNLTK